MPDILYLEDLADEYEAELEYPEDQRDGYIIDSIEELMSEIGANDLDDLRMIARDDSGLISDAYFETYAQDFAESIGAVSHDFGWPLYHIDWAEAAKTLQMDFMSVTYQGNTYWMAG